MRKFLSVVGVITGLTLGISTFLFVAAPEVSIYTIVLPSFLLIGVLLMVPVGFFMSLRGYLAALLLVAGIVALFPLVATEPLQSLACAARGRTPVGDLQSAGVNGETVNVCGELMRCEVVQLGTDGSTQEVCFLRDTADEDATLLLYTYTLLDRGTVNRETFQASERQRLRDTDPGTIITHEGIYYNDLLEGCVVPGSCAMQPLPFGEVYDNLAMYEVVRRPQDVR